MIFASPKKRLTCLLIAAMIIALYSAFSANHDSKLDAAATTTTSFQNGVYPSTSYAGSSATYISQNNAAANYGPSATLLVNGDDPSGSTKDLASIMKWDTTSIPAGKTVTSASIDLNVFDASAGTYELYEMKRNWTESGATWNQYASGSNWAAAGAGGSADRGTAVLGTMTASGPGTYTINLNSSGMALIQTWINNPSANYGMIITDSSSTDGFNIRSNEYAAPGSRPKLTVTYE